MNNEPNTTKTKKTKKAKIIMDYYKLFNMVEIHRKIVGKPIKVPTIEILIISLGDLLGFFIE